jgi:zinc protease
MTRILLAILISITAASAACAQTWIEATTQKGLVIWLAPDPAASQIALQAAWRGGSDSDPPSPKQISSAATALMMEGAGDLDAVAFASAMEDAGIGFGIGVEREFVLAGLTTPKADLQQATELLKTALQAPRFGEGDAERLRKSLKSDLPEIWKQPGYMASVALGRLMLPDHPKLKAILGPREDPPKIANAMFSRWHQDHLARDNLAISIAGAITIDEAKAMVDRAFGDLPAKSAVPSPPPRQYKGAGQSVVVPREGDQTVIVVSQPVPGGLDDAGVASDLLSDVLGREAPSRLFKAIREQRGLSYGIEATIRPSDLGSVLVIATSVPNDKAALVLQLIHQELDHLANDGVGQAELDAVRSLRRAAHGRELTSPEAIAAQMIFNRIRHNAVGDFDREPDRDDSIGLATINRVARDYFAASRATSVLVGMPFGLDGMRRMAVP